MRDNVFKETGEPAFEVEERWFPLLSQNGNCAPGDDVLSLSARRGVRVATTCFVVRRGRPLAGGGLRRESGPEWLELGGRASLAARAQERFPSDPV